MEQKTTTLTRQELYKKIWKVPMWRLAPEYGLSDVGLKKICKKLNIPTPPRGYWAKQQNGYKVTRTPLPKKKADEPDTYTLYKTSIAEKKLIKKMDEQKNYLPEGIDLTKPIPVSQKLSHPHPLTRELKGVLEKQKPDKYGTVQPLREKVFGLRVSPANLPRALRILDSIVKWFEANGFPLIMDRARRSSAYLQLHDEQMRFLIYENANQIAHIPTKEELERQAKYSLYTPRPWDYVPSGKLSLIIESYSSDGIQKKWIDTASKVIEERLHHLITNMFQIAYLKKQDRLERDERERLRQLERERLAEEKRLREIEAQKLADLENQASRWEKSNQLRGYIEAVKRQAEMQASSEFDKKVEEWVSWASQHADNLDPLQGDILSDIINKDSDN